MYTLDNDTCVYKRKLKMGLNIAMVGRVRLGFEGESLQLIPLGHIADTVMWEDRKHIAGLWAFWAFVVFTFFIVFL